ncbi:hypothetical protein J2W32_001476 [Variovorax boronicumulans]|uniref:DUF1376 domain-containing protein n=1 Tax=Variovorax boronicumulans TaxID=436515 RepID=A0AAW8CYC1_9BURK|nr:hypothetical protein [Variovorax boronicumulans]MDP9893219.1 hypothetical protein [Variovorax boronicumulans]MDQ0052434.1 hypothetical protein [Variovorax boronicumulans]
MARIRTTKPEFYTSEQVMNLSIPARFAFQGLWTFCDDGGNHPASAKTLKAEVFPSDDLTSTQAQALVDEMLEQGLLVIYEAGGKQYWHVTGWHHQRIDKPSYKHPKFGEASPPTVASVAEAAPIAPKLVVAAAPNPPKPLADDSSNALRTFHPGVEGIGVEGIGVEGSRVEGTGDDGFRLSADAPPAAGAAKPSKPKAAEQEKPKTADVWEAYSSAYATRYGVEPLRNAKVNALLSQFLDKLPVDEAPAVAAFYVRSNNQFYVTKGHSVAVLLADAEKLRTEWVTGRQTTATQARLADQTQTNANAFAGLISEAQAKKSRHHGFADRNYEGTPDGSIPE